MPSLLHLLSRIAQPSSYWPGSSEYALAAPESPAPAFRVLLVVAHPDDESECAGTLYRITHDLGGVADQVIITDGAGGTHFTAPSLQYYGLEARRVSGDLPRIRRREAREAARVLGLRHQYFLNQPDNGFTLDPSDGFRTWDLPAVRRELNRLLRAETYDLVLVLLPGAGTHGHHKTAAILTLEAVNQLPAGSRPLVAGVESGMAASRPSYEELEGWPLTRPTSSEPAWSFDRRTPLSCHAALDHTIIAHWVISGHKSQGMFQMEYGRRTHEHFWALSPASQRLQSLANILSGRRVATRDLLALEAA